MIGHSSSIPALTGFLSQTLRPAGSSPAWSRVAVGAVGGAATSRASGRPPAAASLPGWPARSRPRRASPRTQNRTRSALPAPLSCRHPAPPNQGPAGAAHPANPVADHHRSGKSRPTPRHRGDAGRSRRALARRLLPWSLGAGATEGGSPRSGPEAGWGADPLRPLLVRQRHAATQIGRSGKLDPGDGEGHRTMELARRGPGQTAPRRLAARLSGAE